MATRKDYINLIRWSCIIDNFNNNYFIHNIYNLSFFSNGSAFNVLDNNPHLMHQVTPNLLILNLCLPFLYKGRKVPPHPLQVRFQ